MGPVKALQSMSMLLLLLCASGFTVPAYAAGAFDVSDSGQVGAFIEAAVVPAMEEHHSPSGVVIVAQAGEIVHARGYGLADISQAVAFDPAQTIFRPGSISKLFTWVAVMQLVEQGKLDLDSDINAYLDTFQIKDSFPGRPVTLRHIMTHTAGFEDGNIGYVIVEDPAKVIRPLSRALAETQPERFAAPGEYSAYSNWATALAGLVVGNVSGQGYAAYVQEHIFDVLGMTHSSFEEPLPAHLAPFLAKVYSYNSNAARYEERAPELAANIGPAGGMYSSAKDLVIFGQALLGDGAVDGKRILGAESVRQLLHGGYKLDDRLRGIGLGVVKRNFGPPGFDSFGHDGTTTDFASHLGLSKQADFIFVSSFSGPGFQSVQQALVKPFYDAFFPRDVPARNPPADFHERGARFAGTYLNHQRGYSTIESLYGPFTAIDVQTLADNTLKIGHKRYVEIDERLFREVDDYGRVVFLENSTGEITGLAYDDLGFMQYYRAPFYQSAGFNLLVIGFSVLVFTSCVLRFLFQWDKYRLMAGPERRATEASLYVAVLNLSALVLAIMSFSGGLYAVIRDMPDTLKFAVFLATLVTLLAFYQLYWAYVVLRRGLFPNWRQRVLYGVSTVSALMMATFYIYWNVFGFNYHG